MIMVDELVVYPNAWGPFRGGSCHLTTDGSMDELHAFAKRLGMRRSWFQEHPVMPHYDLVPSRRSRALVLGAVFVPAREQARRRRQRRSDAVLAKRLGGEVLRQRGKVAALADGTIVCTQCLDRTKPNVDVLIARDPAADAVEQERLRRFYDDHIVCKLLPEEERERVRAELGATRRLLAELSPDRVLERVGLESREKDLAAELGEEGGDGRAG
jgi:hypothetical protein